MIIIYNIIAMLLAGNVCVFFLPSIPTYNLYTLQYYTVFIVYEQKNERYLHDFFHFLFTYSVVQPEIIFGGEGSRKSVRGENVE